MSSNNCSQSFPCSFRLSWDAKYTELEAVYQGVVFFFCCCLFVFYLLDTDSRDKIPKMPEILMTFHCKLRTLSSELKFLFTLSALSPHCCFFSVFPVYHALGDSFTGTEQEGEPEHIPNPLQVQNTKSLCCVLLKNTHSASKAACKQVFCSHQLAWLIFPCCVLMP